MTPAAGSARQGDGPSCAAVLDGFLLDAGAGVAAVSPVAASGATDGRASAIISTPAFARARPPPPNASACGLHNKTTRSLYNDAVWEGTRHGSSLRGRARDTAAVCEGGLSRRSRSRNAARLVKETVETLENVAGARLNGCHNVMECGAFGPGNR